MFYWYTEWVGDSVQLHFKDSDGEHLSVAMNAHDAVEFNRAFDLWMKKQQDRLLDAIRRADQSRRKDFLE
jgi:hypothetical protein